jgi:hypothetical protein
LIPLSEQFSQIPHAIRNAGFHGWRDANRAVNAAEVVIGEVQAVGGLEVFPPLTERVRQPGETAHLRVNGEILTPGVAAIPDKFSPGRNILKESANLSALRASNSG